MWWRRRSSSSSFLVYVCGSSWLIIRVHWNMKAVRCLKVKNCTRLLSNYNINIMHCIIYVSWIIIFSSVCIMLTWCMECAVLLFLPFLPLLKKCLSLFERPQIFEPISPFQAPFPSTYTHTHFLFKISSLNHRFQDRVCSFSICVAIRYSLSLVLILFTIKKMVVLLSRV